MLVAAGQELFLKITHLEKKINHYLIGKVDWSHLMKALVLQTVFDPQYYEHLRYKKSKC